MDGYLDKRRSMAGSGCRPRFFLMPVFGAILAQISAEIPLPTHYTHL